MRLSTARGGVGTEAHLLIETQVIHVAMYLTGLDATIAWSAALARDDDGQTVLRGCEVIGFCHFGSQKPSRFRSVSGRTGVCFSSSQHWHFPRLYRPLWHLMPFRPSII